MKLYNAVEYSPEILNTEGIKQWGEIKAKYESSSILLVNGFSINFSETLQCRFLYEFFIGGCSHVAKQLLEKFETRNFEYILQNVETAKIVSEIFRINISHPETSKREIRDGLIYSINRIHPKPTDINHTWANGTS